MSNQKPGCLFCIGDFEGLQQAILRIPIHQHVQYFMKCHTGFVSIAQTLPPSLDMMLSFSCVKFQQNVPEATFVADDIRETSRRISSWRKSRSVWRSHGKGSICFTSMGHLSCLFLASWKLASWKIQIVGTKDEEIRQLYDNCHVMSLAVFLLIFKWLIKSCRKLVKIYVSLYHF